jgi:hypothetical protein
MKKMGPNVNLFFILEARTFTRKVGLLTLK